MTFPKNIWIFWEQGWKNAPYICKLCKQSWITQNPNWKINVLDKNKLSKYIDVLEVNKNFWNITPISTRADIIRTLLLSKYGGVWVDATTLCNTPLDKWLFKYFDNHATNSFFFFKYDSLKIANWFIVSNKNSYIIEKIKDNYVSYFIKNNKALDYFQYHATVKSLVNVDKKFNEIIKNIPLISARTARFLNLQHTHNTIDDEFHKKLKKNYSPVYKLTHKKNYLLKKKKNF